MEAGHLGQEPLCRIQVTVLFLAFVHDVSGGSGAVSTGGEVFSLPDIVPGPETERAFTYGGCTAKTHFPARVRHCNVVPYRAHANTATDYVSGFSRPPFT